MAVTYNMSSDGLEVVSYTITVSTSIDRSGDDVDPTAYSDATDLLEQQAQDELAGRLNNDEPATRWDGQGWQVVSITSPSEAAASGTVQAVYRISDTNVTVVTVVPSGNLAGPRYDDFWVTETSTKYRIEVGVVVPTSLGPGSARQFAQRSARSMATAELTKHVNKVPPANGVSVCAEISGLTQVYTNSTGGTYPDNYLIEIWEVLQSNVQQTPCPDQASPPAASAATPGSTPAPGDASAPAAPVTPAIGSADDTDDDDAEKEDEKKTKIEPIDFQCVLLEKIHKLAAVHSKDYLNVIEVDTNGDPGTVLSRIQHGAQTDQVRQIMDMCPEVHALLVPFIKISRVEYDDQGKATGNEKELKIPNFLSGQDVQQILSGDLGRAPGAGIKSFSWELKGVQSADVDNNITADLEVYFQSIGDFFDLGNNAAGSRTQAGLDEPTFLDLIINSPGARKAKGKKGSSPSKKKKPACGTPEMLHQKYEGKNFRIKVCAGWAVPPNLGAIFPSLQQAIKTTDGSMRSRVELLEEAIRATRASLFLQQVRHDLDFNENGSLTLKVKYQAALSGLTTNESANIFSPGSSVENISTLRAEKKQEEEKGDDADEDKIKKLLKKIDKLEQADRKEIYDKLLKKVYTSNKVYQLKVPVTELLIPDVSKLDEQERIDLAKTRRDAYSAGVPQTAESAQSDLLLTLESEDTAEDAGKKATKQAAARYKDVDGTAWFASRDEFHFINYIYLGDLFDLVLEEIKENEESSEVGFQFFMSEIEFIDILLAFQIKEVANLAACKDPAGSDFLNDLNKAHPELNLKNNLYQLINIGDIPIALDAFQAFFIKNVIDKERGKYYFLHFVKDLCAQLITRSLRTGCYGTSVSFSQRFDAQPLSLYKKEFGRATTVTQIAKAKSELGCHVTDATKFNLGMILFSTDAKARGLVGKYDQDVKKGVYHHYIGSACGLVKTIKFQREDQKYLREANIQKFGELGPEQLRELYSVNIDLVGNNLYRNGSLVYVSPLLINTTKQQLTYLGLHGYYLVTAVTSKLTESSFTTSIRALQEGIEFPQTNAGSATPPSTDPESSSNNSAPAPTVPS